MFIIAGIVAAASVWVFRELCFQLVGPRGIIYLIPIGEEVFKTYWAMFFGASILLTHGFFGLIRSAIALTYWRILGFTYGISLLLGHLLFGYITYEFYQIYQQKVIAIGGAYFLHIIWNMFLAKLTIKE